MMTEGIVLAVIGGGSSYTPELVEGILKNAEEFPVRTLRLMDIDETKLNIVGSLVGRMIEKENLPVRLELTEDRRAALKDADFIVTQIRVGGIKARIRDEKIPLEFNVIGQETTGAGGFANALRTVPVMLDIAKDIEELSPDAWLINFTNPSGIVAEALLNYTRVKTVGLCNVPIGFINQFASMLEAKVEDILLDYVGLNHLSWVRKVYLKGKDVTDVVIDKLIKNLPDKEAESIKILGMIPNGYLHYYYEKDDVLSNLKTSPKTRGEVVLEIEEQLMKKYQDKNLREKPPELSQRGGAHYSDAAVSLMKSIYLDKKDIQIVNVKNNGAITDLSKDAVVEVPCIISGKGAIPLSCGNLEPAISGLTQTVKYYEQLTIEASITGDRKKAKQALLVHPLIGNPRIIDGLLEKIIEENREFLPNFF
ncbi:MAG TPA: 6-phospho-beta-glucosidase [bacterium]|nr:6-phospho-beta-glucosidase [bacterium]